MSFCLNSGICSSTYKKSRWHNESNELGVCYSRKERGKTYCSPKSSFMVKSNHMYGDKLLMHYTDN